MVQSIHYFVSGHTAGGYVNHLRDNLQHVTTTIVLKHEDDRVLTGLFNRVVDRYEKDGWDLEVISGLSSEKTVVGVIIREKQLAILAQSIVQNPIPKAIYLDLEAFSDGQVYPFDREREEQVIQAAYAHFRKSLQIHDDLEAVYIQEMDFAKADQVAADFINQLLQGEQVKKRIPDVYERLFITNTPDGKVNHAKELIAPLENVYYVKGRAGTGKSVLMKKIMQACTEYGFDVEVYRCSFDPESVDMIIVRELGFAVLDSTPPHELFPEDGKGTIIDLYTLTVTQGTDEQYAAEIDQLTKDYLAEMKKGMRKLRDLHQVYGVPESKLRIEPALQALNNTITKNI